MSAAHGGAERGRIEPRTVRARRAAAAAALTGEGRPAARAALALLLALALAIRVWGVAHGLPYSYNADENAHFVPKAIALFGHGLNPGYFINPPAYTYLLHVVFAALIGGREAVSHAYAVDPTKVFVIARATSAALGALAVGFLYLAGARLLGRRGGLLAAALLAFGFLPVFYSHLALNDVPTLAPLCLALWGAARIAADGRRRDYALAGIGLGLACATKYTGGIVLLPILAAAALRLRAGSGEGAAAVVRRLAGAALLALLAFFLADPYAFLDWDAFRRGLAHQSSAAGGAGAGKLGLSDRSGIHYYLWTLTWGLGWAPAIAAALGACALLWRRRALAALLVPAPLAYLLFMGLQERYFGRWLLPVLPLVCLLAAAGALMLVERAAPRRPGLRAALGALAAAVLLAQGVVYSIHGDLVLSRPDTRNLARAWMVAHVPPGTKVVVEPFMPDAWANDIGRALPQIPSGRRWNKFPTSRSTIGADGRPLPHGASRVVNIEDYERVLRPALVHRYLAEGWCWVVSGSTQSGRAYAQPREVPGALAYYRALRASSRVAARFSPYRRGARPLAFDFDWSFDFYPLAYARPGPVVTIYRLRGGACRTASRRP